MIRYALRILVAAFTAVVLVFGTVLCILLWDDRRARAFVLLANLVLAGCAASSTLPSIVPIAPPSVSTETSWTEVQYWNKTEFYPTTMQAYIYSLAEECTGLRGDFFAIHWYAVDFLLDVQTLTRKLGGWVVPPPREILLDRRYGVNSPVVLSHESIHDLLGGGTHDDPRFAQCEIKTIYPVVPR